MSTQTYIPADQNNPNNVDIEAMLQVPLAIAKAGIRKARTFLLLNILNTVWIAYFYKAHADTSILWMTPIFLILALVITHQWFLYFALRSLLQFPAKMQHFSNEAGAKTSDFFRQNEEVISRMQGNNTQPTEAVSMFGRFGDMQNMSAEMQDMMSAVVRTLFLGNPIILALSISVSSLLLFGGLILLVIHIV